MTVREQDGDGKRSLFARKIARGRSILAMFTAASDCSKTS
jgi:hypothetical protein